MGHKKRRSNDHISADFQRHLKKAFDDMPSLNEFILFDAFAQFDRGGLYSLRFNSITQLIDDLYLEHRDFLHNRARNVVDNDKWLTDFRNFVHKEIRGFSFDEIGSPMVGEHIQVYVTRDMTVGTRRICPVSIKGI